MTTLEEKNTYYIDYGTGAGNFEFIGTLEEAMEEAAERLCYTQLPVTISVNDEYEIACLPWYDVEPSEDDVVTASFGDFGFYGEWRINE